MVTPDFPPAPGGIQLLAHRIARQVRLCQMRVVTRQAPGGRGFDGREGLDVSRAPVPASLQRPSLLALNTSAVVEGARFRPDAVLSMHIVTSPAAWTLGRLLGVPFVQYLHASEVDFRPRLAAFAVRRAAATIAVSSHTARLAANAGAPADRVHTIPPGVDIPSPPSEPRFERPTVVTVARLDDRFKGHDVMLRALPLVLTRVPAAQWLVIGQGRLRGELERQATRMGLSDHVRFLGALPDAERDRCLGRAHLFAMPSRRPAQGGGEGFGIAYLEAGASGLPVVAGRAAGATDAVADGETGLLVDPDDPAAVAGAISELLLDRDRASALGRSGRERARQYAWPLLVPRIERLLVESAGR